MTRFTEHTQFRTHHSCMVLEASPGLERALASMEIFYTILEAPGGQALSGLHVQERVCSLALAMLSPEVLSVYRYHS
jgi:hypothetical protein